MRRNEVPTGKMAIHCVSGGRSAVSSALLSRMGHDVVYINGEFAGWSAMPENTVGTKTTAKTEPVQA